MRSTPTIANYANSNRVIRYRLLSTGLRTFLVVLLIGFAITTVSKPTYQCTEKIFVESGDEQQAMADVNSPLSGLFTTQRHIMANQIEMILGDRVATDTCRDADIPPDSITTMAHQIPGTNVLEITVQSASPVYAERYVRTLPNTYKNYVMGNRAVEMSNALMSAEARLKEQNDRLLDSEIAQYRFVVAEQKSSSTVPYIRRLTELQRENALYQSTADTLSRSIEDLRLRSRMTHNPVLVISDAKPAKQISPSQGRFLLLVTSVGLTAGLFASILQHLVSKLKRA